MAQGWGYPVNASKAHYFEDGETISLCRRWMFGGVLEDDRHTSPDNCAECKRKRLRLVEAERNHELRASDGRIAD